MKIESLLDSIAAGEFGITKGETVFYTIPSTELYFVSRMKMQEMTLKAVLGQKWRPVEYLIRKQVTHKGSGLKCELGLVFNKTALTESWHNIIILITIECTCT